MTVMEAIRQRRSIRRFQRREIPASVLKQLLEAIQWAPSWANTQCWEIVLVRGQQRKEELRATLSRGNPAAKAVVEAPVVLVFCGKLQAAGYYRGEVTTKFGDWFMYDLGIATQNLCLAAHAHGLGTVIVGLFDHDRAAEILQVPKGYEVVSMVPVGYPLVGAKAPERRRLEEFTHLEAFGAGGFKETP